MPPNICRASLDQKRALIAGGIPATSRRLAAINTHPPRRLTDRALPSSLRQRNSRAAIRIKFETAIDKGKVKNSLLAGFGLKTRKMPARMMAALMRHQKIAIARISCRLLRSNLYDRLAVELDYRPALCLEIRLNIRFNGAERIV